MTQEVHDIALAAKLLLDASKLIDPYYPEVSAPILKVAQMLAEKTTNPNVDKYTDILLKEVGPNPQAQSNNTRSKDEEKGVLDTILDIREKVIDKLKKENEENAN